MTADDIDRGNTAAQQWAATPGARVLDDLRSGLQTYVVLPDEHALAAVTLWIAATHALPAFECAPRLVATSPDKRCGKSRLLDVISGTCHRPLATADATVAAVFRSIGTDHPPTLIIDEADTKFGNKKVAEQHEDLRALINAGHQRGRPALRCVGPMQIPTEFPTFTMAALAGIGSMPDTITDRAVNITMRRRTKDEKVSQFRGRRDGPILQALSQAVAAWVTPQLDALAKAEPDMPVEDRAADTWEPLVAVADAAGGHWPTTARAACAALVNQADDADEDQSLGTRLLSDIHTIFTDRGAPFLPSGDLVNELRHIEESPWNDFELTTRKLALRLKAFGIKPQRNTAGSVRGYSLEALHDTFSRYLRHNPSDPSETPSEQEKQSDTSKSSDGSKCQTDLSVRQETAVQEPYLTGLTGYDDSPPENGHGSDQLLGPPGAPTDRTPGMTDRVKLILANSCRSACDTCGTALSTENATGTCAECRFEARTQAVAAQLAQYDSHHPQGAN